MTWSRARIPALVAITAAVVGLLLASTAQAGALTPSIRVNPTFQNVSVGSVLEVDIIIQGAPTFASYEFHISFDPSILEFVSVSNGGDILEDAGRSALCLGPEPADLENAIISYACASTGGSGGPSGTGLLANLSFNAICAGRVELAFGSPGDEVDPVTIAPALGNSIVPDAFGGAVNVNGVGCPDPGTLLGDANCNGTINSIDAALVLQINAGLVQPFSCEENADVNGNGMIDSIDAALILQFTAGLIGTL